MSELPITHAIRKIHVYIHGRISVLLAIADHIVHDGCGYCERIRELELMLTEMANLE